ncbi:hypothetical protein F7Q99_01110 [Streptomyces kaniharaensis]|uniref:Uncharacterized protein n=1 Tax=Streptomyces kaniharaensis TaxID=212423 RepID=A0A6N7KMR2_9ACTN|nr:hypothetical protein [Streptomyces kaniharaensis]MQS10913.1 hypothetical protein [Streptomyces kaniharaensis]
MSVSHESLPSLPHDILRVRVTARDADTLRALLREVRPDVGGRPSIAADGTVSIDAYVPDDRIPALEREGVTVTRVGNASAAGRAAQAEVGEGDRFAPADAVPRGLAAKFGG